MATATVPPPDFRGVVTLPGVYPPQSDSLMLAEAMRREGIVSGMDVLDVCTGSGALAVYAARLGARVTAVDVGRRAVLSARVNAFRARQRITVRHSDLLRALPRRRFDLVVSNPPYVPAPDRDLPNRGAQRAWDAGPDGRALVDRLCDAAPDALAPGGVLLLVHSDLTGPEATLRRLRKGGLHAEVTDRRTVPFGPVLRERLDWLQERGLVGGSTDQEGLVVVRAQRL